MSRLWACILFEMNIQSYIMDIVPMSKMQPFNLLRREDIRQIKDAKGQLNPHKYWGSSCILPLKVLETV